MDRVAGGESAPRLGELRLALRGTAGIGRGAAAAAVSSSGAADVDAAAAAASSGSDPEVRRARPPRRGGAQVTVSAFARRWAATSPDSGGVFASAMRQGREKNETRPCRSVWRVNLRLA